MLYLIDRATGRVLATYERDYYIFIEKEWGGWFPYVQEGLIRDYAPGVFGVQDPTKVWSPVPALPKRCTN